jgi:hypothetical protein
MSAALNLCPECSDYAPACACADLDAARAAEQLVDYPCYSCGEESTHEIRHNGGWLDVCDECDLSMEAE